MKRLLTVQEFLDNYALSRSSLYRAVKAGDLKITKIGRSTRVAVEDAEAWLASLSRDAA